MLVEARVHEADVRLLFILRHLVSSVGLSSGGKLFELHDIASQSPSLITEHVLNLPQLFIQVTGLRPHLDFLLLVKHFHVIGHHQCLPELHYFEGYQ